MSEPRTESTHEEQVAEKVIWDALAEAQRNMEQPVLDSIGRTGRGGERTYKYASLASVRKAVFPPCNELGIFITQHFDGDNTLITEAHLGDQFVVLDRRKVTIVGRAQEDGSNETYAKRYALCSVFGLAGVEDDDGEAAMKPQPKQPLNARCGYCGKLYSFESTEQMASATCPECNCTHFEAV